MKKRNWLMTIAFAVLSLTIISTCVIGSTYAKFVSKVGGNGSVKAAGFFLSDGGSLNVETTQAYIGPNQGTNESTGTVKFFSQVPTTITVANNADGNKGTGVFADANWAKIVTYYNTNFDKIAQAFGYGVATGTEGSKTVTGSEADLTGSQVKGDLKATELISVSGAAANDIATAIGEALKDKVANNEEIEVVNNVVTAPAMTGTAAAEIQIKAGIKWVTLKYGSAPDQKDNNLFDTFVGYCIARLEAGQATIGGDDLGYALTPETLTLTDGAATDSTFSVALSIKAEQVLA